MNRQKAREALVFIIRVAMILLFSITLIDKVFRFSKFKQDLFLSPLIPQVLIMPTAISVIIIELVILAFLSIEKQLKNGLLLTSFTLSLFGFYLLFLAMFYDDTKPCACGFILEGLSYKMHIILNFILSLLTYIAAVVHDNVNYSKKTLHQEMMTNANA
ncbi:hypothetical protein M1D52_09355 [Olivibacter sp. SA151]|uniref:MauE/DoxX family redox-associated membrane protein n=1 Tax=Olivibacter jilunii TaxID=985016 RepID=UPI003F15C374